MSDQIDIAAPIKAICDALGLDSDYVKELRLTPTRAQVTLLRAREDGSKYVLEEGEAAFDVLDFRVLT